MYKGERTALLHQGLETRSCILLRKPVINRSKDLRHHILRNEAVSDGRVSVASYFYHSTGT